MSDTKDELNREDIFSASSRLPIFKRGLFWMFAGVFITCGGTVWFFFTRYSWMGNGRPPALYVAIFGFLLYVFGRILQIIQKSKKK